ncbi:MAG: hypothetical protein ACYSU0_19675 [Planctomycetota bacterium]|jgi:hypothetical protein
MAKERRAGRRRARKGAPVPTVSVDGIEVPAGLLKLVVSGGTIGNRTDHSLTYGMFAVPTGVGRPGTLRIQKRTKGENIVLKLSMSDGQCRTCVQKVNATMRCRNDRLSTPLKWSVSAEMFMAGRPVPLTKITKTASVNRGAAEISDVSGTRKIDLPGAYTINWALFDAVGRLPRKRFDPIEFDMIDHFDQLKPASKLHFRSTREVTLKDGKTTLHLFDHFGFGIVPWTYFVDDNGVMVLALGGLEAYGLVEAAG